jgi:hypothetical protein
VLVIAIAASGVMAEENQMTLPGGDQINYDGTYYDFRAADGKAMLKLWVPPNAHPVRGILISGHGGGSGDSRNFARDANMKAFAARFGFGLAGLHYFPGRTIYEQRGKVFFDALDGFAGMGHHPELANVPFAIFGSSNGGATSYGFANYAPERCICFVSNVAAGGNPPVPTDGAIQVPGVFVVGRYDPFSRELQGVGRVRELVSGARARGGRWAMLVEEKGHEDGTAFDLYAKLLERAVALRYPADADPRVGPVALKLIPESDGWLGTMPADEPSQIKVTPFADYAEDRAAANWLLDADAARTFLAAASARSSPVSIGVEEVGRVYNPNTAPGTMYSVGGPLVEPGRSLRIVCDVRDLPDWQRIAFYDGDKALGAVVAPADPVLAVTVGNDHVVWCLNAVVTTSSGATHHAAPFYFAVVDSALELRSQAELNPPIYADAVGAVGSKTMLDPPEGYAPKAGGVAENILIAYGLTAEQEQSFGADPKLVSAFWNQIDDAHDSIRMAQTTHAREGSTFSVVHTRDALLTVKAAHSARGLYLCFAATDNQFLPFDPDPTGYYQTDAVAVLLDSQSSAVINDPINAPRYMNQEWGLFLSTTQYQIAFGRDQAPPMFRFNYADPWDMNFRFETFENAKAQKGIVVRWVKVDKFHRVQEWFIPWTAIGRPGDIASEPAVGTRLGFAPSYTDRDKGGEDPGLPKTLTWIGKTSPWAFAATRGDAPKGWGDIEIGPGIGAGGR